MNYWQGSRVKLRSIEPEDAEFFHQWNQETDTQQFLDRIWFPSSRERQKQWTAKMATQSVDDDHFFFLIENREAVSVGMIHTRDGDRRNGHFTYSVALRQAHRRQGYAGEAIRMVLAYYFAELRYHKVTVEIFAFNTASIALHEKVGFQLEGRLRQMKYGGGRYFDVLQYGLLAEEFHGG